MAEGPISPRGWLANPGCGGRDKDIHVLGVSHAATAHHVAAVASVPEAVFEDLKTSAKKRSGRRGGGGGAVRAPRGGGWGGVWGGFGAGLGGVGGGGAMKCFRWLNYNTGALVNACIRRP